MKLSTRILLSALAGFLASCGVLAGPTEAYGQPPVWPTCNRAPVDAGHIRVWVNPGTLYEPNTLSAGGVTLTRRRDGIFTGVVDRPDRLVENYVHFDIDNAENGFWVKCKKVTP